MPCPTSAGVRPQSRTFARYTCPMKKTAIGAVLAIALGSLLFMQTYTSSPGFGTEEMAAAFYANSPTCHGFSIPLNIGSVYADASGWALCIGRLERP